jgi:hypothetical protein
MSGERGLPALPQDTGKPLKLQGLWVHWLTPGHACATLPSTEFAPMTVFFRPFFRAAVLNASYWWRDQTAEGAAASV